MRLASLARKIKITPSSVSGFVSDSGIELTQGSNTKLTDEQIDLVLEHFDVELPAPVEVKEEPVPEVTEEVIQEVETEVVVEEPKIEEEPEETHEPVSVSEEKEGQVEITEPTPEPTAETVVEEEPQEVAETPETPVEEPVTKTPEEEPEIEEAEETQNELEYSEYVARVRENEDELTLSEKAATDDSVDVIKAPKVKLPGLSVKGKIDLPEPKSKEDKEVVEKEEETKKVEEKPVDPDAIIYTSGPETVKRKPKNYKGKKYDKGYSPAEAAKRKKVWEKKQTEAKNIKLEKEAKEAKKKHYRKNVKNRPVQKPKITKPKAVKQKKQAVIAEKKEGNAIQRFWSWMNT